MYHATNELHANPSGDNFPEALHFPRPEGQPTQEPYLPWLRPGQLEGSDVRVLELPPFRRASRFVLTTKDNRRFKVLRLGAVIDGRAYKATSRRQDADAEPTSTLSLALVREFIGSGNWPDEKEWSCLPGPTAENLRDFSTWWDSHGFEIVEQNYPVCLAASAYATSADAVLRDQTGKLWLLQFGRAHLDATLLAGGTVGALRSYGLPVEKAAVLTSDGPGFKVTELSPDVLEDAVKVVHRVPRKDLTLEGLPEGGLGREQDPEAYFSESPLVVNTGND